MKRRVAKRLFWGGGEWGIFCFVFVVGLLVPGECWNMRNHCLGPDKTSKGI